MSSQPKARPDPRTPTELADLFERKADAADREVPSATLVRQATCEGQAAAWRWAAEQVRKLPGAGDDRTAQLLTAADRLDTARAAMNLAEAAYSSVAPDQRHGKPSRAPAGGPMSDDHLAKVREFAELLDSADVESNPEGPLCLLVELLADRDYWHAQHRCLTRQECGAVALACELSVMGPDAVRATAASKAAEFLSDDEIAKQCVDREAEIARLRAASEHWHSKYAHGCALLESECRSTSALSREVDWLRDIISRAVAQGEMLVGQSGDDKGSASDAIQDVLLVLGEANASEAGR